MVVAFVVVSAAEYEAVAVDVVVAVVVEGKKEADKVAEVDDGVAVGAGLGWVSEEVEVQGEVGEGVVVLSLHQYFSALFLLLFLLRWIGVG